MSLQIIEMKVAALVPYAMNAKREVTCALRLPVGGR